MHLGAVLTLVAVTVTEIVPLILGSALVDDTGFEDYDRGPPQIAQLKTSKEVIRRPHKPFEMGESGRDVSCARTDAGMLCVGDNRLVVCEQGDGSSEFEDIK